MSAAVIDIQVVSESRKAEATSWVIRFLTKANRWFRRQMSKASKMISRLWYHLPAGLRAALVYGAVFIGYFMAFQLLIAALVLGFAYGLVSGLAVIGTYGMLLGYWIYRVDPNT